MCGLAGFVNTIPVPEKTRLIAEMADSIRHRGPDDFGQYVDGHLGMAFRWSAVIVLELGIKLLANGHITSWTVANALPTQVALSKNGVDAIAEQIGTEGQLVSNACVESHGSRVI